MDWDVVAGAEKDDSGMVKIIDLILSDSVEWLV
jgi:hypothetical protein